MTLKAWSRAKLLALPVRDWNAQSMYSSIMLVPTGKKHDSGWHLMAIVGSDGATPKEIAAYCDDVVWDLTQAATDWGMRTDMLFPAPVVHMWGNRVLFHVGMALSSTAIKVVLKEKE